MKLIITSLIFALCVFSSSNLNAVGNDKKKGDADVRHWYEDNYHPDPHENFPAEYDQRAVYWPREHNDSRFIVEGMTYIHSWEQDPPNGLWLNIVDSRPTLTSWSEIDLLIASGKWDDNKNLMIDRKFYVTYEIKPGWNRVYVNIHNYKSQIISANLTALRSKSPIIMLDMKED
jgi:hypothetical protein